MPTISQLPPSNTISPADEIPVSQGGATRAVSVGTFLASTQPAIIVASPALIGRTSLGSGGPEQVDLGVGLEMSTGTLVATGLDHGTFPTVTSLSVNTDLVISNQGSPMLMQASLLRELFSAGQNVAIDPNGVISANVTSTIGNVIGSVSSLTGIPVVASLASQDLVAVNHAGSNCAIAYSNFFQGLTIDQGPVAGAVNDIDTIWAAQGNNVMSAQNFAAIWMWIQGKLSTYTIPAVEITSNTSLDVGLHNKRLLICSQPLTLLPAPANLANGFQCSVVNASSGSITLGSGFVSSTGNLVLTPWQSASLWCATYSKGTITFAAISGSSMTTPVPSTTIPIPGQVMIFASASITSTTVNLTWQAPTTGGPVAAYLVQYRISGTAAWNSLTSAKTSTMYQLTALLPGTSYDFIVQGENATGLGSASAICTAATSSMISLTTPGQVSGVSVSQIASNAVQVTWQGQNGINAATSFTVQYRVIGSSNWTTSSTGNTGTTASVSNLQSTMTYDFSVFGLNAAGTGPTSTVVSATTLAVTQTVPAQINEFSVSQVSSNSAQVTWQGQTGANAATSFIIQYRLSGTSTWMTSSTGNTGTTASVSNLQSTTAYDFSVFGLNAAGIGPTSAVANATTLAPTQPVTSIRWNLTPSGTYSRNGSAIAVNAHVVPATSQIQLGFSLSSLTPPTSWFAANLVNNDLWGQYVPPPATAGTWYTWAEGLDGSAQTLNSTSFMVQ